MRKKSTTINEVARKVLQITRDEYALCSYVQYRQADRRGRVGWCVDTKDEIAKFIGITRPGLYKMIDRLSKENLLFSEPKSGALQVTELWIDTESECKQSLQQKNDECKQSLQSSVNKVYTKNAESVNLVTPIYEVNNKVKLECEEITPLSENGKTEVTLHSPDHVDETFLHVVENVSLEAEQDKDYSGAGPGEETPASQDAGTLKAECFSNNPPPIFFNPELQRRYNGTAPTNGKARKTPAQDRTAQICAELKTPEVLDFFHAIHAAWGEWTDYKRREKKGTYKTAKTEAATIAALAKTVNYDPAAGRTAIEHSIAHTYTGIYPPKDAKPTAEPCARYSMQDGPRATTSEEMTLEISRFYNANKDKYASLLRHPGMERYTVPKLKEAVSLFCASRIKQNRGGETFQQQHAALEQHFLFLIKREREDAAKQAGPQSYNPADLRAAEKIGR